MTTIPPTPAADAETAETAGMTRAFAACATELAGVLDVQIPAGLPADGEGWDWLIVHLREVLRQAEQLASSAARLRQERNEARQAHANAKWLIDGQHEEIEYLRSRKDKPGCAQAHEDLATVEAERDAERERYTRLVGEVERRANDTAAMVERLEAQQLTTEAPRRALLALLDLRKTRDALRSALAATAPQTAPAQPALGDELAETLALADEAVATIGPEHVERRLTELKAASFISGVDAEGKPQATRVDTTVSVTLVPAPSEPTAAAPEPVRVTDSSEGRDDPPPGDWVSAEVYWVTTESLRAERDALADLRMQVVMALCTEDDDEERTDEEVVERVRELTLAATNESLELDRLRSAHPAGDEHLQALRDGLTERGITADRPAVERALEAIDYWTGASERIAGERDEAQREAERLRDEASEEGGERAIATAHAQTLADDLEKLRSEVQRVYDEHADCAGCGCANDLWLVLNPAVLAGGSDATAGGGEQA